MSTITRDAEGTVTGNTYDKYGSSNPVVKKLMAGFERTLDELWAKASPRSGAGRGLRRRRTDASPPLQEQYDTWPARSLEVHAWTSPVLLACASVRLRRSQRPAPARRGLRPQLVERRSKPAISFFTTGFEEPYLS